MLVVRCQDEKAAEVPVQTKPRARVQTVNQRLMAQIEAQVMFYTCVPLLRVDTYKL